MAQFFLNSLFFIFLAFCISCTTSATKENNKTKALLRLELGTTYLMRGNYPLALQELTTAESLDPDNAIIQNNLGLAYLVREKYDKAEFCLKKALLLKSDYTDARNNLGRLYIDVGLLNKAINELELAANDLTYEQPEKSWSNLGEAYFKARKYELAKKAFKRSLKDRRESCHSMNFYGRSLFELEEYAAAADTLDRAVTLCESSKFDEPHFYSGLSFYKMGKLEQARARFNELIQLHSRSQYVTRAKEMLEIMQ